VTTLTQRLKYFALAASLATTGLAAFPGIASAGETVTSLKILEANFEARQVVQVEVGDFHFTPGQVAPLHTHDAPAVGYVAKGEIIYQVEGEKQILLRTGDTFYEPTDKRILKFDNASATQEAIFIDFNLEQQG
jgi:quercetin dioxygenase-like cupin family protein